MSEKTIKTTQLVDGHWNIPFADEDNPPSSAKITALKEGAEIVAEYTDGTKEVVTLKAGTELTVKVESGKAMMTWPLENELKRTSTE